MKLTIYQPSQIFLEQAVVKITAESPSGAFGILPRHVDLATALATGILAYETPAGDEVFVAVNGGILVKLADQVSVATRNAVGGDLGELQKAVEAMAREVDEKERKARAAVARLEADIVRRFMEFGRHV